MPKAQEQEDEVGPSFSNSSGEETGKQAVSKVPDPRGMRAREGVRCVARPR